MRFANLHPTNIGQKVEIIVEHFRANVAHLLEGHAKAMVVTDSRQAALRYKIETDRYLRQRGYAYQSIVAFSGSLSDEDYGIEDATEASMNPGVGSDLAREFRRPEYRLMIVADKFQTGFDQPLLCAMYVDKKLPDVHAVQTLSRLNRTYRAPSGEMKDRTFVLDFVNDPDDIREAFLTYYLEAHVEKETDPNLVHQLATKLAQARIYTPNDVERYAEAWWAKKQSHSALAAAVTPARDEFNARWNEAQADEDSEALDELRTFRKDCGSYVRLYDFMSQVVDYGTSDLEKLAEFLRQLVRLLPTDGADTDVDVSGLELRRVRQIDQGRPTSPCRATRRLRACRGSRVLDCTCRARIRSRRCCRRWCRRSTSCSGPSSPTRRSKASSEPRPAWPRKTRESPTRSTTTLLTSSWPRPTCARPSPTPRCSTRARSASSPVRSPVRATALMSSSA
jgi:type I restriction enzyme R subunit